MFRDINPKLSFASWHIDTIGLGDNSMRYNDKEILNHIEKEMLKIAESIKIEEISAIIVTESYFSNVLSLPPLFSQITNIFGHFPEDSIIVLGTKRNEVKDNLANRRLKQIH